MATFFKCDGLCLSLRLTNAEIKNPALAVAPCVTAANAAGRLLDLLVEVLATGRAAPGAPAMAAVGAGKASAADAYKKEKAASAAAAAADEEDEEETGGGGAGKKRKGGGGAAGGASVIVVGDSSGDEK
jgi:hypothetical protein